MLRDNLSFDFEDFQTKFSEKINDIAGDNESTAFNVNGNLVNIGNIPVPIPAGDIENTAPYAYNWSNVLEDVKNHKSHLIVSVAGLNIVEVFKIFTQIVVSLLRSSNAIGVYMGSQSLIIPTEDYLEQSELMSEDQLPLNLWIYFGLVKTEDGNAGYTYGLKEFEKKEMEVLHSRKDLSEIRDMLFNITHYVLDQNVEFETGQTCGLSKEEKILITLSKGKMLEGETFKLDY